MSDRNGTPQIEGTVARVQHAWYRVGMPRRWRRRRAEELQAHLQEAVADGRAIDDVVGDDIEAFAAEWSAAERSHTAAWQLLEILAALTLLPGVAALLNPWLHELFRTSDDRVGVPVGLLTLLAVILPFQAGWQALRVGCHRLERRTRTLLGIGLTLYLAVATFAWAFWLREIDRLLPLGPLAAWTLVVVGAAALAAVFWPRR